MSRPVVILFSGCEEAFEQTGGSQVELKYLVPFGRKRLIDNVGGFFSDFVNAQLSSVCVYFCGLEVIGTHEGCQIRMQERA